MCGCENMDNDYYSSNEDDEFDPHADSEVFAFSAADDEGIKFVGTYADEEDLYADPTVNDRDAPAEAEGSGEADQLDGQETFELETAVKNSQSMKCHCCGRYGHLTQHCELLSQMPNNRETWRLIVRLKRDGPENFKSVWNDVRRTVGT